MTESIRQKKTAMTVNEASEYTGIGRNSLRKLIAWKKNLVKNGEMNITQKQLYDDYIKARRLEERG